MERGGLGILRESGASVKKERCDSVFRSVVFDCWLAGNGWDDQVSLLAAGDVSPLGRFVGLYDGQQSFLANVEFCHWCRKNGLTAPTAVQEACAKFWGRAERIVQGAVRRACPHNLLASQGEDLAQEVRLGIVENIRDAVAQERPFSYLFVLAWRKARDRLDHWIGPLKRHPGADTILTESLPSRDSTPDASCLIWDEFRSLLAELRSYVGRRSYEVFVRWFLRGESAEEIATGMKLTLPAVYHRYERAKLRWDTLVEDSAVWRIL
jgi:DNA-directed RNA polymerase specialized sigma24 family protein